MAASDKPASERVRALFRPSQLRGGANHGWLKTFHTFSFADYYDPSFEQFGCLRVINEDRVDASTGFPTHPHREAEIFSYIVSGELSHKDSMGNVETMVRGDVQMTSGGTGIRHSEYNDHKSQECHFLQIWALPNERGLKPTYYTRHFTDEDKMDKVCEIVAPAGTDGVSEERDGRGPTPIHASLHFYASLLTPGASVAHTLKPRLKTTPSLASPSGKLFYAQLVQTSGYNTRAARPDGAKVALEVAGKSQVLGEGDGWFVSGTQTGDEVRIANVGDKVAELVLFEMDA
ncbi:hypothetical protein Q5752_004271 [Cryptotrichosporon argae]